MKATFRFEWLADVVCFSEFPDSVSKIAAILAQLANSKTGMCYPSIGYLESATCKGRNTVIRATEKLEAAGFLKVKRMKYKGSGKSNEYTLIKSEISK